MTFYKSYTSNSESKLTQTARPQLIFTNYLELFYKLELRSFREFPGGPAVRTWCSHPRFDSWSVRHGQKIKNKKKEEDLVLKENGRVLAVNT